MNTSEIPRIAAPLALAAALLLSFRLDKPVPPVELQPGEPAPPPAAQVHTAFVGALAPGAPGYDRGVTSAPVTVLAFADFGCRYCARFAAATYPALAAEFVKTGRVRWKDIPFAMGMFPNGGAAARAAECAADQGAGAFARMHDLLYQRQRQWTGVSDPAGVFASYAATLGLNGTRFAACYASHEPGQRLRAANDLADQMGVNATPTFFVNGYRVEGALPVAQFRELLLEALHQSGDQ